jgi:ribosome-associated protein
MSDTKGPEDELPVSKSQLKREARALFDFGKRLSELPEPVLLALPLERDILDEVLFARSIRAHVARKRQLGFLAKKLRSEDLAAVEAALDKRASAARELNARHHRAEAWRDHLLESGDAALSGLLEARHDLDVQTLRQLLRNAQREAKAGKPPASARKLFRLLRDADDVTSLPPCD